MNSLADLFAAPVPPAAPPFDAQLSELFNSPIITGMASPRNQRGERQRSLSSEPETRAGFVELSNVAGSAVDLSHGAVHLACWVNGSIHAIESLRACGKMLDGQSCVLCDDAAVFESVYSQGRCSAPLGDCAGATEHYAIVHLQPALLSQSPTSRARHAGAVLPGLVLLDVYGSLGGPSRRRLAHDSTSVLPVGRIEATSFAGAHVERLAAARTPRGSERPYPQHTDPFVASEWVKTIPADPTRMAPGSWAARAQASALTLVLGVAIPVVCIAAIASALVAWLLCRRRAKRRKHHRSVKCPARVCTSSSSCSARSSGGGGGLGSAVRLSRGPVNAAAIGRGAPSHPCEHAVGPTASATAPRVALTPPSAPEPYSPPSAPEPYTPPSASVPRPGRVAMAPAAATAPSSAGTPSLHSADALPQPGSDLESADALPQPGSRFEDDNQSSGDGTGTGTRTSEVAPSGHPEALAAGGPRLLQVRALWPSAERLRSGGLLTAHKQLNLAAVFMSLVRKADQPSPPAPSTRQSHVPHTGTRQHHIHWPRVLERVRPIARSRKQLELARREVASAAAAASHAPAVPLASPHHLAPSAQHHIFLSCRLPPAMLTSERPDEAADGAALAADVEVMSRLRAQLEADGMRVVCSLSPEPSADSYAALRACVLYVPLLSAAALAPCATLSAKAAADPLLVEYGLALALRKSGRLRGIAPVITDGLQSLGRQARTRGVDSVAAPSAAVAAEAESAVASAPELLPQIAAGLFSWLWADAPPIEGGPPPEGQPEAPPQGQPEARDDASEEDEEDRPEVVEEWLHTFPDVSLLSIRRGVAAHLRVGGLRKELSGLSIEMAKKPLTVRSALHQIYSHQRPLELTHQMAMDRDELRAAAAELVTGLAASNTDAEPAAAASEASTIAVLQRV